MKAQKSNCPTCASTSFSAEHVYFKRDTHFRLVCNKCGWKGGSFTTRNTDTAFDIHTREEAYAEGVEDFGRRDLGCNPYSDTFEFESWNAWRTGWTNTRNKVSARLSRERAEREGR